MIYMEVTIMAKMLFINSNGFEKAGRATRVFQFAKVAREKGHDVYVFLIDDGIIWAQLGMAEGARASTGEEMRPFIDYLLQHDSHIYACGA
jgi:predicted peroxiredoxin